MRNFILFQFVFIFLYFRSDFSKTQTLEEKDGPRATVRSLHVISDIKYRYATTRVSAEYINNYNSPAIANFHVTLPSRAYISEFSMTRGNNVTYGVVKKKEEAKEIYEEAVARGESTGYIGVKHRFTNVYDISVNVEAGKIVLFNLTYQELLERSLGKYRHVVHLINKEVINDFVVEVFISEPQDIVGIEVPKITSDELSDPKENVQELESATIEYIDSKNVLIKYNPTPEEQKENGQNGIEGLFKVNYDVDRHHNSNIVYTVDGYFVHFYTPDSLPALPKNIVFMLDVSISMEGGKLQQLKQAMETILKSLMPGTDSFLIGYFSDRVHWMNDGVFKSASKENIFLAVREVKKLRTIGGTNINQALLDSVSKLNSVSSIRKKDVLFFLTDGLPSVGVQDTRMIRQNVKEANNGTVSFYMLGFGADSNIKFLKEVATENGGFSRKIYIAADSQLQIEALYNEISNILLKDIEFTYLDEEVDTGSLTPTTFVTCFKGSEIVTTGRLNGSRYEDGAPFFVSVKMTGSNGTEKLTLKLDPLNPIDLEPSVNVTNYANLTRLSSLSEISRNTWVFLTLKKLLEEDRTEEVTMKIISLALEYGFVTPLTSMVVTKSNLVGRVQEEEEKEEEDENPSHFYGPSINIHKHFARIIPRQRKVKQMPSHVPFYDINQMPPSYRHPGTAPPQNSFKLVGAPTKTTTTTTTARTTTMPRITEVTQVLNETKIIDFIPGIILKPYHCNETLCLRTHKSCQTHTKLLLLADSQAFVYIYGYLQKRPASNCMEAFKRLVIKKKRKVFAEITPETMTKNQKVFDISNKDEVLLSVKKYLKLRILMKVVDHKRVMTVEFNVLNTLPRPNGILAQYLLDVTCRQKGLNQLSFGYKSSIYQKVFYETTNQKQNQCYIL